MRLRTIFALLTMWASSAAAQGAEPIKPHFVLLVDTSGSMFMQDAGANSCGYMSGSAGTQPNRMDAAKCTVTRLVSGSGDALFGLARFKHACTGAGLCSTGDANCGDGGEILVPIAEGNQNALLSWVDGAGALSGSANCSGSCSAPELRPTTGTNTLLVESLATIQQYFADQLAPAQPSPIMTDRTITGRPDRCRPYRVITIGDSGESCVTPVSAAITALRNATASLRATTIGADTYDIKTYAIGYGVAPGDARTEAIATGGGTDNPFDASNRGFYAQNESELSLAFSRIVQDSLLVEVCNGVDDNCNGATDEGFVKWCNRDLGMPTPTSCTPIPDDCDNSDDNCVAGTSDEPKNACGTCGLVPQEVCNGVDDDCNGLADDGVCGGCVPSPEICDGRDNDCDGRIDEGAMRSCGTCVVGMQACLEQTVPQVMGAWGVCSGSFGTAETCNGADDDCDGITDLIPRMCGTDTGECVRGFELCVAGAYDPTTCTAVGPATERCNGLDDNCNNMIDEGNPGGGASCNDPVGCGAGTVRCVSGRLECVTALSPQPESCDGMDNDCDGMTDEGIAARGPCGSPVGGACQAGSELCTNGRFECVGYSGPTPERCNCADDDCDGMTDEPPATGSLCPTGSLCTDCQCAQHCASGEFPCPAAKACVNGYCVADPCAGITCVGGMVCRQGSCVDVCEGVSCVLGEVCLDGRCLPDNCHTFTTRCGTGEVCRGGQCVLDRCASVTCGDREQCTAGACVSVCSDATCAAPLCNLSRCAGVICPAGSACDATTGSCVSDPCIEVRCPDGFACRAGRCVDLGQCVVDAGLPDAGPAADLRLQVAGSGGCACRTGGHRRPPTGLWTGLLLALALGARRLGRARRR